ncbi:MAG: PEP-CTERM sorting domain-containing protein [Desulfurivibrio sp.]|jgi:hypothetical protein|nr:MAG: PEP-CTERM sorting domain-containing protein [Desulfurivibrio sp.]
MPVRKISLRATLPGLLALAFILAPAAASAYTYSFRAYIDGESDLIISGNTVQWHNLQWDVPGITSEDGEDEDSNFPTTITTADMGAVDWYPGWPGGTFGDQESTVFTGLDQSLTAGVEIRSLVITEQRDADDPAGQGSVIIWQLPELDNDYTLILKFDDAAPPGAAWYTVELNTSAVPLPGAVWLLGSGLLGLVGLRRKNRK